MVALIKRVEDVSELIVIIKNLGGMYATVIVIDQSNPTRSPESNF